MRTLLVVLTAICCFTPLAAQCTDGEDLAYRAYVTNSTADYAAAVAATQQLPATAENHFTLASLAHQAATMTMVSENTDELERYLDLTEQAIDDLWELDAEHPGAHGLYSGYLGLRIAQTPMKGMIYGSKAAKYARTGVELGPDDPVANYFLGSNLFYTPEEWGGNKKAALAALKTAAANLPAESSACDWMALQILTLYGQAQAKMGDKDGARTTYLRALAAEPDLNYVKYDLLPRLDKEK
ncbi:hypothetical protein [Neolewinella antarctica]|uniref:Tetratricopeptide (TPR) repeat protein n=1 Tax=Neolewinella antarctica TaxID=442734 RepID=A0ABX0X9M2_9BACT|nr:hypothetical protein [Neolewinella antarctica]NJC25958.1 tetratricopeptide (TPR) repeat protein [Neolewinella antarctica]